MIRIGIIDFKAELVNKEYLAPDIVLLSFKPDKEISFKEGQYLFIRVENKGKKKMKAYSILSPPSQKDIINLCIKIVDGGFASEVFDEVEEGETFSMRAPFGRFVFEHGSPNQTLIAVGTGIAPMYSMLKENLEKYSDTNFRLLFGARTRKELVFHDEFLEWEEEYDNFEYLPTITREKWEGRVGRVQKHIIGDLKDTTFYICGLKEMVLDTKALLLEKGVETKDIKFERYS